jgi:hypothetical protein
MNPNAQRKMPGDFVEARKWLRDDVFAVTFSQERFPLPLPPDHWTAANVTAIAKRVKRNPSHFSSAELLSELGAAPLEKVFDLLMPFLIDGRISRECWAEATRRSKEPIWLQDEEKAGRNPERIRQLFFVAGSILISHQDGEEIVTKRLQNLSRLFSGRKLSEGQVPIGLYVDAREEALTLLDLAEVWKGSAGYRIMASFLSSPDSINPVLRRSIKTPPAAWARSALARRMKIRWDEKIPDDVAGARLWWTRNKQRFTGTIPQTVPAKPGAKGFQTKKVLYSLDHSRMAPGSLSSYVAAVVRICTEHYAEVSAPAVVSMRGIIIPDKRSYVMIEPDPKSDQRELLQELNGIEAPAVDEPVEFLLYGDIAGGFRSEEPETLFRCGNERTLWTESPGNF